MSNVFARFFTLLLTGIILCMAACSGGDGNASVSDGKDDTSADSSTLSIAVMPTLDCLPIYVAQRDGLFDRESLSVRLCPFMAQMDCDTAIAGGTVQALVTDLVRGELLSLRGTPLRYVASTDLQWQLLTSKAARIKQLKQLDDKMVAVTRYSATALLADQLVDSAKLVTERVFRIQVNDVLVRLSMMETGVMDAMLLPEPQATVARMLQSNVVYDSSADTLRLGVIAFSEKALADTLRHQQMQAFVRAYDSACDSIAQNGLTYYRDIIADRCHVKLAVVDSLASQTTMRFLHAAEPRQSDIDRAKAWLGKVYH